MFAINKAMDKKMERTELAIQNTEARIAKVNEYENKYKEYVIKAAATHDLGKIAIDDDIFIGDILIGRIHDFDTKSELLKIKHLANIHAFAWRGQRADRSFRIHFAPSFLHSALFVFYMRGFQSHAADLKILA